MKILIRLICGLLLLGRACSATELKTKNVLLVTLDGLRWQEVFRGMDPALTNKEFGGVSDKSLVQMEATFAQKTADEQRHILMPFLWNEVAGHGQLYGNRDKGSAMRVSNPAAVSYPGYNEMLTGSPDPAILNNARIPNPHITVLEWLNGRPGFQGHVVPLAAWNVFSSILNVGRSGLPLWVTNQHSDPATASPRLLDIEQWMEDIPTKDRDEHYDGFVFRAALDAIETKHPRVLFVGFGEPDTYGHRRAYDSYLDSIRRCDRFIRELWEKLQSLPQYRGTTTLIVTTDHGRGAAPKDWAYHKTEIPGSEETWLAVLGPDTPSLGERHDAPTVITAQVAATVAGLLGEDFRAAFPAAAEPIAEVFPATASTAATGPEELNEQGLAAHRRRDLGEASRFYTQLLKLEPPGNPTPVQQKLVLKFAPRLHNVAGEFFPLKDIVAILHPDRPVIGYHLFWEDDIAYPSDNEPCDHEIVWVEFDPNTEVVTRVSTYFHGRVLAPAGAVAEANAHGGRPWIGVEWGFHGSIPWGGLPLAEATLRTHWGLAHKPPPAFKPDPLARGWPTKYPDDYDAYVKFDIGNSAGLARLKRDGLVFVSRWPMATINRYGLRYNCAAKLEWPWLAEPKS